MGSVAEYRTLEHVAMQARPYPSHLLDGCETGLALFAAAFLGHNDAIHFAEAGMQGTCVDRNADRILQMRELYPHDWIWIAGDAWIIADIFAGHEQWDIVSVDTFTGAAEDRSLESLDLWCSLARKAVTVTITLDKTNVYRTPPGWRSSLFHRAKDVYWLVLERQ